MARAWKQDGASAYHVEKGLLPDQIGQMPTLSHMPHYYLAPASVFSIVQVISSPLPQLHTQLYVYFCVYDMGTQWGLFIFLIF